MKYDLLCNDDQILPCRTEKCITTLKKKVVPMFEFTLKIHILKI